MTVDCNGRYVQADPETGTAIAVAEAARNITCSGGEPSAITNCLNFGNPYNPQVYWQFVGAIKGMSKACEKFKTPVTGGNVSFYNQSEKGGKTIPVFPTPAIGMIGIVQDKKYITSLAFQKEGDYIYLLGESQDDINSSEYLYAYHKVKNSPAPYFDLEKEFEMHQTLKSLIQSEFVTSAHDCADGGLFVTLLESAMPNNLGFDILTDKVIRKDAFLFGEGQGRVVISVSEKDNAAFLEKMKASKTFYALLGKTTSGNISIDDENWENTDFYKKEYDTAIEKVME